MYCSTNFKSSCRGSALLTVLILLTISAAIVGSMISISSSKLSSLKAAKKRTAEYHEAERAVYKTVQWLRDNSQKMVTPFRRGEFYDNFDRVNGLVGSNDTSNASQNPVMVQVNGSGNSALVSNDDNFGTDEFPATLDITTNAAFDVAGSFNAIDFGEMSVKLTLLNGAPDIPSQDQGAPPNPAPGTDFYPVYRIDAMSNADEGVHVYAIVKGDLAHVFDMGIYGQDYLEINQPCDSYVSNDNTYSDATKRPNCPAGSNSTSAIHKNEEVYGTMSTNGSIIADPPYGGETCADFQGGCPNKGETCAGEDCGVPLLEIYQDWNTYCPAGSERATIEVTGTIATPEEITVTSSDPSDNCIAGIVAGSNEAFRLTSTDHPYFIGTLDLANNAQMIIDPQPSTGKVEVYVNEIVGGKFNGNQSINAAGNPTNFTLIYLGSNPLDLNGNADLNVGLVAPNAEVTVSGAFDYHGALLAKELTLSGSGEVHYDESLGGGGPISDIRYRIVEIGQYYR